MKREIKHAFCAIFIFQTRSRTLRVCGAKYNQKWIRILHQDIKSIFHIGHNLSFVKFHSVLFLQSAIFSWFIFLASVTGLWLGDFPFKIFIFGNLIGFQFIHPNYPFFQKIIQKFPMVTNSLQNISTHLLIMEVDFCPVLCIPEVPVLQAFRGISHFVWYCKAVSDLS